MSNYVRVTAENADELLLTGMYGAGAVIRVQNSADGITYASLGTVALVSGTRVYGISDTTGTAATWYRSRYENAGGSNTSDWSDPFQAGGEDGGLICSLYDVRQRLESNGATLSDNEQEQVLDYIREVTDFIHTRTGRLFTRTPSNGTTAWLLDVPEAGRTLWMPKGVAAATTLEVATSTQPETGGTYATVPVGEWFLRPATADRDTGWPATRVVISDLSSSSFYPGYNTVRLTGALGFDRVPPKVAGIGAGLVVAAFRERASSGGDSLTIGIDGERRYERSLSYSDRLYLDSLAEGLSR